MRRKKIVQRHQGDPDRTWLWKWTAPVPMRSIRAAAFSITCWSCSLGTGDSISPVDCKGDTEVDYHHTVEDIGHRAGACLSGSLWVIREGIYQLRQYAAADGRGSDTLTAVDIGGRSCVNFDVEIPAQKVGDFDTELVKGVYSWHLATGNGTDSARQDAGRGKHPSHHRGGSLRANGQVAASGSLRHRRGICGRDPVHKRSVVDDSCDRLRCRKPVFP